VQFVDNLLVEPRRKGSMQVSLEGSSKKPFGIHYLVRVLLEMLEELLGKNPSDDLFLRSTFLVVRLSVLQLSSVVLLLQSRLIGFQFLGLSQMRVSFLLIPVLFLLLLCELLFLVQFHLTGFDDFA
jgi:hypothetical protein